MQIREENGWSVPHFEQLLSGSCRPSFHVHYRDWDHIKTTIFNMEDKERHTFVDVGANIGLVSVPAKQYFKNVYDKCLWDLKPEWQSIYEKKI